MTVADLGLKDEHALGRSRRSSLATEWMRNPGMVDVSLTDLRPPSPPDAVLSAQARKSVVAAKQGREAVKARNTSSSIF
jgi:hypothetical protein